MTKKNEPTAETITAELNALEAEVSRLDGLWSEADKRVQTLSEEHEQARKAYRQARVTRPEPPRVRRDGSGKEERLAVIAQHEEQDREFESRIAAVGEAQTRASNEANALKVQRSALAAKCHPLRKHLEDMAHAGNLAELEAAITEAQERLSPLEAEQAGIGAAIQAAVDAGDFVEATRLRGRAHVLPGEVAMARLLVLRARLPWTNAVVAGLTPTVVALEERANEAEDEVRSAQRKFDEVKSALHEKSQLREQWRAIGVGESNELSRLEAELAAL